MNGLIYTILASLCKNKFFIDIKMWGVSPIYIIKYYCLLISYIEGGGYYDCAKKGVYLKMIHSFFLYKRFTQLGVASQ